MNRYAVLLTALLFTAGCGGGTMGTGKVVFDDGTPLTRGEVRFVSGGKMFSGMIKKDGTFVMEGATPKSGIEPGNYEVSIVGAHETTPGDNGYPQVKPLIAQKFSDPKKSGLTCSVKGNETIEFKVSPP